MTDVTPATPRHDAVGGHRLRPVARVAAGALALAGVCLAMPITAQPLPDSTRPPAAATPPAGVAPRATLGRGYLASPPLPADVAPPPPAAGSAAEARDREGAAAAVAQRGSPRWVLATRDAQLFGPEATRALSCAAGLAIGPATTPKIDALLRRTLADFGMSTAAVKRRHQRARPFMVNGEATCTPEAEAVLRRDGSYPSGHSAIGFGWGLILAELLPDRAGAIMTRARAFGDSRRICNAHWLSDTEEGRLAAAANFARLNADPDFQRDLAAARAETLRPTPPRDCAEEAAALAATR